MIGIVQREFGVGGNVARGEEATGEFLKGEGGLVESEVEDEAARGSIGLLVFVEGGDARVEGGDASGDLEGELKGKGGFAGARLTSEEGEADGHEVLDDPGKDEA